MISLPYEPRAIIGRREMVTLPELDLTLVCKIDTGARTSALHAEEIEIVESDDQCWVSFTTWTGEEKEENARRFTLPIHDRRSVRSSNGVSEWRYVIQTPMRLGQLHYAIELTLVDRNEMRHPMLLGRRAMRRLLVAPGTSFLHGAP